MSQRPVKSSLVMQRGIASYIEGFKANDVSYVLDRDAGTLVAKDGDTVVMRALQKGKGQPWIVAFYNSDRITWAPTPLEGK